MSRSSLEEELPELSALLGLPCKPPTFPPSNLRRSPRKKPATIAGSNLPLKDQTHLLAATTKQSRRSPSKGFWKNDVVTATTQSPQPATQLKHVPWLPRGGNQQSASASSNNRSSPQEYYQPAHIPTVDSLLLPLSKLAMQEDKSKTRPPSQVVSTRTATGSSNSMMPMMTEAARPFTVQKSPRNTRPMAAYTSRYVLKEARCNDDRDECSSREDEEDEETDLSGFIVDDNADLSYHEWSESDLDRDDGKRSHRDQRNCHRLLYKGSRSRTSDDAEYLNLTNENDGLSLALPHMTIGATKSKRTASQDIEVIDLTSSPAKPEQKPTSRWSDPFFPEGGNPVTSGQFDDFEQILKLSPPIVKPTMTLPEKSTRNESDRDNCLGPVSAYDEVGPSCQHRYTTPPATPPHSPSKLKSPSKLLSPSKRNPILRSPHRQSTDAFWDLHAINEWHDLNSPRKAPATSPRKRGLTRFHIWSNDSDDETSRISENSLPSPCESPTKPRSPLKSSEKAEKERIVKERKAEKTRKAVFDTSKRQLAQDLFDELDAEITNSKLGNLAASTGGVKINWSKTLRSTAGRANWRRTVTKKSGSPIKGNVSEGPGLKVEHFANIELAEKVIDCEERLVNTLAHEYCHLANFMVSNIRDQPHGASFKTWATQVTKHLRKSENELWRKVEVTTKHNYAINHKYLWICVGRDKTKAMEFLNISDDGGCGVEYGRHSRSIDTEKSRCGRCKGKLIQVRPKPRMSPVKKIEKMMEVVELSD